MHDLIYLVVNHYAANFAMGSLSVYEYYQIVINNVKNRLDIYRRNFYMNFHGK